MLVIFRYTTLKMLVSPSIKLNATGTQETSATKDALIALFARSGNRCAFSGRN